MKNFDDEVMRRAYSILDVKQIEERAGFHLVKGIASTPTVDRVGDIVEPMGAKFALPLPLLMYHDSHSPVGKVVFAKPTKNGIPFEAEIPKVTEAGVVKDRVDEALHSLKYDLIGAVSIGFRAEEKGVEFMDEGGIRFNEWEWLELSLVPIPANPDARITSFKAFDDELRAAIGAKRKGVESREVTPGASGNSKQQPRKTAMRTLKEQIAAFEARRAANAAEAASIMQKAGDTGETLSAEDKEKFDTLEQEITEIDGHLKRLKSAERLNAEKAAPVGSDAGTNPDAASKGRVPAMSGVRVTTTVEPGVKFARMAMCVARAKYFQKEGRFMAPEDIYRSEKRWMDSAPEVHLAIKTAVNANDSTTAAAASEWAYAQNIASEFIEYLRPRTLLGRISGWRRVPFNVRVGGMDGGTTGYWVGQGLSIPSSRPTSTSVSLGITKVAGMSVITKELAMLSTPSAETMVRDDLARAIQQKSDTSLIDPNAGGTTNVQPASLTYGVTARQASGTDYAAFKADWKAMTSNFYAANISLDGAVIIMKEELAEALSLMVTSLGNPQFPGLSATGGTLMGRPVFVTQVADTTGSPDFDNLLILLQPAEVFLADDGGASVEASDQVSIQMDDAPTNKSAATATGASLVSMFQTESIAIKGVRHVNWTKARSQACQFIRSAAYV
jgi:HK97 family phage major capsid protein/HK97 family phage prohead protease